MIFFGTLSRSGWAIELRSQDKVSRSLVLSRIIRLADISSGGWDAIMGEMKQDPIEEIDQAFKNVQIALTDAGGKGWPQVYSVKIYVAEKYWGDETFFGRLVENLKKWVPDHQPLLSIIGVTNLGAGPIAGMRVEIEVAAHDPVGTKTES